MHSKLTSRSLLFLECTRWTWCCRVVTNVSPTVVPWGTKPITISISLWAVITNKTFLTLILSL